ncbi:hypothetical protein BDV33DRAFT_175253 [Aspergillus novoparasiticus]|uniref:Uncharacterized protein n=1 Tax=Aspergillus novoparasiticus TaxID=986946 RepID=A0A5N6ENG5_9EURO|nr:hypothetical protein BDV33DRAFT_175253 [Aspergillus novoparasiticus]
MHLQSLANYLRLAYKYYDPLVGNLIFTSFFNLLTSTALAAREEVKAITISPSQGGQGFPWYIREKDGAGEAFTWFTFPKSHCPKLDVPIEATLDMTRFLCLVNDIFHSTKNRIMVNWIITYTGSLIPKRRTLYQF